MDVKLESLFDLKGKVAIVTGAHAWLGNDMARALAEYGCAVIITSRELERARKAAAEIAEAYGVDALGLQLEQKDYASVQKMADDAHAWKGRIDILINNAGGGSGKGECNFLSRDPEAIRNMIDINLTGSMYCCQAVGRYMAEAKSGVIINIGSVAGDAAYAGGNVYCATKAAVKALSDGLRIDVANTAVRVTNLKPGLVETNFSNIRFRGDKDRAANVYKGIKPLTGDDIADVAVYAANAPEHVQIAEVLILATHQASGSMIYRTKLRLPSA